MKTSLLLLACLTLASLCEIRGADTPRAELIGRQVPNFILPSVTGKEIALADYPEIDFLVFVFLGTECPIGNSYIPQLNELSRKYPKEKVRFVIINANLSDSDSAKTVRGIIIHQHGCGEGACKSGETAAYDLHWQALAAKWDCALLGPSYRQAQEQSCRLWCDP